MNTKLKDGLVAFAICALMVTGIFSVLTIHAVPVAPSVKTIALPSGSKSISLATDGTYIYYGSYALGDIYKVDPVAGTYQTIFTATAQTRHYWTSMTYWVNSGPYETRDPSLFLIELGVNNATLSSPGNLYQYHLGNGSLTLVATNVGSSASGVGSAQSSIHVAARCLQSDSISGNCTREQSFLYAASGNRFFIIEWLGDVSPGQKGWWVFPYNCQTRAVLCNTGGTFPSMTSDSSGNVYFTDRNAGKLFIWLAEPNSLASYSGFTKPTGVAVVGNTVQVAENVVNGNIAQFSLTSNSITGRVATNGAPFDVKNVGGVAVWSSNSTDHQICTLSGPCVNTNEANYYMAGGTGGEVFFGYLGSAGVGVVTDFAPATYSTYTFTSVSTYWGDKNDNMWVVAPSGQNGGTYTLTSTSSTTTASTATSTSATTTTSTSSTTTSSSTSTSYSIIPTSCNLPDNSYSPGTNVWVCVPNYGYPQATIISGGGASGYYIQFTTGDFAGQKVNGVPASQLSPTALP